jgi:hypothetical protein
VGYPIGIIRRHPSTTPRRKAEEQRQQDSHDETAADPTPEVGFDRRIELFGESHFPGTVSPGVIGKTAAVISHWQRGRLLIPGERS